MGYAECNVIMESRSGSVSSGLGSCSSVRRPISKSSPFCPSSSSKLTQSIIKDHMISHYKKVYSAKAAIDASVPKSLLCSVKYNDRIRQERQRKGSRSQSAYSLSHKNGRTSSSSSLSCSSVQYDESPYYCSRSSMVSSPKFTTSFHAKKTAYPSCKINSHPTRTASETKYWSPEATLQREQCTRSLVALGEQSSFRTFQDPVQKTYSGDLLQKHSQHFTEHKPFTPKTLRSEKSSYLSKYRYYRAPERTSTQDYSIKKLTGKDTHLRSAKIKEHMRDFDEPSQEFLTEHEWSEDDFNDSYLLSLGQHSQAAKSQSQTFMDYSPRFSPEGGRHSKSRSVSAEEEELLYLEFISDVTEDILSKGHISDRIIDRVMKRHIDMNLKKLNEAKMRHLLEVLREDLKEPPNMSSSRVELEIKDVYHLDSTQRAKGLHAKTKEDNDLFSCASLIKSCDYNEPLMVSTHICSPARFTPNETNEDDCKDVKEEEGETSPPLLSEHLHKDVGINEEDLHQTDTTVTNKVSNEKYGCTYGTCDNDQAILRLDGQSEEVEHLGRNLSELLHVSSSSRGKEAVAATENTNIASSGSDDEF